MKEKMIAMLVMAGWVAAAVLAVLSLITLMCIAQAEGIAL